MKNFRTKCMILVVVLCTAMSTQAQENGVTLDFDNNQAHVAMLQSYVETMKSGDAVKLNAYFNDDALIVGLGSTMDTISKGEHLQYYKDSFQASNFDITGDVYLAVKTDSNAAVDPGEYGFGWGTVTVTNKTTQKSAEARFHVVGLIANGKFSFLGHYYDTMPFALSQGYTLTPPNGQ